MIRVIFCQNLPHSEEAGARETEPLERRIERIGDFRVELCH